MIYYNLNLAKELGLTDRNEIAKVAITFKHINCADALRDLGTYANTFLKNGYKHFDIVKIIQKAKKRHTKLILIGKVKDLL